MFYITKGKMILKGVEKLCGLLMEGQIFRQREMSKIKEKFKSIKLLILTVFILILTSCAEQKDDTVNIWYYEYEYRYLSNVSIEKAIEYIEKYAEINDIKIGVTKYSYKDMSYDDYALKRNLAIEHGEADIILDNIDSLYHIRKYAGDYSKLVNYENIIESFRGGYCIPLCYDIRAIFVKNEVPDMYGVKTDKVINLREYYEMKQTMKENGARFKLIETELYELIDYYALKNNLKIYMNDGIITVDKDLMINTVNEILDDIDKYYAEDEVGGNWENDYLIYEMNSNRNLTYDHVLPALNINTYKGEPVIKDYIIALIDEEYSLTYWHEYYPWLFINKNSTNENLYKIADALFSDGFQYLEYNAGMGVVTNTDYVMEYIGFEVDGRYTGEKFFDDQGNVLRKNKYYDKNSEDQLFEMMEKAYKALREKDTETIYDYVLLKPALEDFIFNEIKDMKDSIEKSSIDKRIDDFIKDFNINYN